MPPQHAAGNRREVQCSQQQGQSASLRRAAQCAPQQEQVHRRINRHETNQHRTGNGHQHVAIHLVEEVQQLKVVAGAFLQQLGTQSRAADRQKDAVGNVCEGHGDEHTRTDQQAQRHAVRQVVRAGEVNFFLLLRLQALIVQHDDRERAVRADRVTAAVTGVVAGGKIVQNLNVSFRVSVLNGLHNVVAFKVGFSVNAVRDLQGEEAETHTGIVRTRRQPIHLVTARQQPAVRGFPETHVVAFLGVSVHFLLVGKSLRLTKNFQRGDRRLRVGTAGDGGENNLPGGDEGDIVSAGPSRVLHDLVNLLLGTDQTDIDRVAEQAVRGAGAPNKVVGHVDAGHDGVKTR